MAVRIARGGAQGTGVGTNDLVGEEGRRREGRVWIVKLVGGWNVRDGEYIAWVAGECGVCTDMQVDR